MKPNLLKHLAGALLVGLASLIPTTLAVAQNSPVGTWDCLISGAERGVAFVTFYDDGTLEGYEVITPKLSDSSVGEFNNDQRNDGSVIGRVITPPKTSTGTPKTNFIGLAFIQGRWTFDRFGRVAGVLTEGNDSVQSCTTNEVVTTTYQTNIVDGTVVVSVITQTNFVTSCETNALTNGVSFVATVKPGARMTLKARSGSGDSIYRGIPAVAVADISGFYLAVGRKSGGTFNELLTLSPSSSFLNAFDVAGLGAGYETEGLAVLSARNQVALLFARAGTEDGPNDLTVVVGPMNIVKGLAKLKGSDVDGTRVRYTISR